jgi:hypothetical protein
MLVTCERFSHSIKAGEEKDAYFELDMKEFRPHAAKFLRKQELGESLSEKLWAKLGIIESSTPPVLLEIPRPTRGKDAKGTTGNIFMTTAGCTTICAIAKKLTGSSENWKEIYDENRRTLGDILCDGDEIPVGTEIKVPRKYVTDSSGAFLLGVEN